MHLLSLVEGKNNVLHVAITWQLICGPIPYELVHTYCTLHMCIDSVWHWTIIYSIMCAYVVQVVGWLHHSSWFYCTSTTPLPRSCVSIVYTCWMDYLYIWIKKSLTFPSPFGSNKFTVFYKPLPFSPLVCIKI